MHFFFNFIEHKISGRMQGQNVLFASVSIQYLQLRQWADRRVAAYRFFYLQHRADVYTHTHTKHKKKKKNRELWIKESDQCWQWKLKAPVWLNRKKFGVRHLCAGDLFYSLWDREPWKDAFHLFENLKNSSSRTRCLYSYWIKWWSQRKNPRLLLCRSCIFEALNKGLWLTRCDFTNEF